MAREAHGHHWSVDDTESAVRHLYASLLEGWNQADAEAFAAPFAEDGEVIGFDGSPVTGRTRIAEAMDAIFRDHATGSYVGVVRRVRRVGDDAALLRAVSGVVPAGAGDINPDLNAVQSLVAERLDGEWRVVLYHNTPAAFHGRPDEADALSAELRQALSALTDDGTDG
jgi:uncharacterized protein (TIGR02246 family)